jgi:hypothetical protein
MHWRNDTKSEGWPIKQEYCFLLPRQNSDATNYGLHAEIRIPDNNNLLLHGKHIWGKAEISLDRLYKIQHQTK